MIGEPKIEVVDPRLDTDEDIARVVAFGNDIKAELYPDDAPNDVAQAIRAHRARPERIRRWSVRASVVDERGDPRLVGVGNTAIDPEDDDNPDMLEVGVYVAAGHRRRGIATGILRELVAVAEAEGRSRLLVNTNERNPAGAVMAEAVGGMTKQAHHINRLLVSDTDRGQLERWVAEAETRAAAYELIGFDGPCPDEHLEGMISQILVLNTAPRDDLEMNDFTLTPEEVREHDRVVEAAGIEEWTLLARHVESGDYAGMHDVNWDPTDPTVVWVGLTGVEPSHRGHGIGKWLKAEMMLRILDQRPQVTEVRTGNADSNDAMLGINRAMGYRPFTAMSVWEIRVDDARAWLATR